MGERVCLRCDWTGGTDGETCPRCGAPLYRVQDPTTPREAVPAPRRQSQPASDSMPSSPIDMVQDDESVQPAVPIAASRRWWMIGGGALTVVAVLIVATGLSFDRTETPAVPGPTETGPTQTGLSVAPDPNAEGINGLPPEGATPSAPERGELVVALTSGTIPGGSHDRVWVYADGRVISRVYVPTLEPYSGLVEQHLTPEGVESLRSSVLSTGLFEHDLDLVREDPLMCCLEIQARERDRLVHVTLGPRSVLPDREAPQATPEQAAALRSLEALLSRPESWPASVWTDREVRAYVPTNYSFCSRSARPPRILALIPERARDLLISSGYPTTYASGQQPACARVTTEEARALARILMAEFAYEGGPSLAFSFTKPGTPVRPASLGLIAVNPVLPHGESAGLAGLG